MESNRLEVIKDEYEYENERRGSRPRALERSFSYSEAIGANMSARNSIDIPRMVNTEVYTNDLKKQYRISQTYVEGKEITFPNIGSNVGDNIPSEITDTCSSEDDGADAGIVMTIDVDYESPKSDTTRNMSDASTRPMVSSSASPIYAEPVDADPTANVYDRIDTADSLYEDTIESSKGFKTYSTPYTKRKRKGIRHRRRHGRPIRSRRVVNKNGEENVPCRSNIPSKSIKYMRDIVNTVINSKWRFILVLMVIIHFCFWLLFAGIWYAVAASYAEDIGDGKQHCVTGTSSFAGLLMMSVETQMTIGYGVRYPNEECPEAIIVMVLEIVAGTALSGGLSSLLFTKLVRPNRHVTSVGFSKKATVCLRDGQLCLQFRVWDLLNVHMISSTITAYMLKPIRTLEGEFVNNYLHQLELKEARAFLLWPITVVHVIDEQSPLYDLSAEDMMDYRFEIVVCLTGSSKNMGTVTQSRTSYLSKEIIWGYRFKNVLRYSKKQDAYVIDTENLNSVEQVETPLCSASRLKMFETDFKSSRQLLSTPTNFYPTNVSFQDSSTMNSKTIESLPSSPSFNRMAATQRSFGWNFRKFDKEPSTEFGLHQAQ